MAMHQLTFGCSVHKTVEALCIVGHIHYPDEAFQKGSGLSDTPCELARGIQFKKQLMIGYMCYQDF